MQNKLVIVLLNSCDDNINGLISGVCMDFLPYRGKPLIADTIYRLTQQNVKHFIIFHDKFLSKDALTSLRKTARWGTGMEFAIYDGTEQNSFLSKMRDLSEYSEIIISGGDLVWEKNLASSQRLNETAVNFDIDSASIFEKIFPPFFDLEDRLRAFMTQRTNFVLNDEYVIKRMRSLRELYDANMRLKFNNLSEEDVYFEKAIGIFAKQGAGIDPRSVIDGELVIGANSMIHRTAALIGKNIIGENVYVDSFAKLENCLVFDDTYVGEGTAFKNCIISKNTIFDVGKDQMIKVLDESVLDNNNVNICRALFDKMRHYLLLFGPGT